MAYIGQAPTPLPLTATDIPDLPATKITSGTFPALNGSNLTNLDASDLTGTLPAISGANLTGVSAGKLLKYANDFETTQISLTNTSWTDTGLEIAFTPTASDSTLVVKALVNCYVSGNHGGYHGLMNYKVLKDGSIFGQEFNIYSGYGGVSALINAPLGFTYSETAGSTSARTYKVQVKNQDTQTGSTFNQYDGYSALEVYEIGA
tara:strand:+ start:11 stop:625 length:615 start_codon:yes stop_codon:yes gene_type:complete